MKRSEAISQLDGVYSLFHAEAIDASEKDRLVHDVMNHLIEQTFDSVEALVREQMMREKRNEPRNRYLPETASSSAATLRRVLSNVMVMKKKRGVL